MLRCSNNAKSLAVISSVEASCQKASKGHFERVMSNHQEKILGLSVDVLPEVDHLGRFGDHRLPRILSSYLRVIFIHTAPQRTNFPALGWFLRTSKCQAPNAKRNNSPPTTLLPDSYPKSYPRICPKFQLQPKRHRSRIWQRLYTLHLQWLANTLRTPSIYEYKHIMLS
jgi:hypothetical protein